MKTKHFKNYISILAIINYRNWLFASPPLDRFRKYSIVLEKWLSRNLIKQILSLKEDTILLKLNQCFAASTNYFRSLTKSYVHSVTNCIVMIMVYLSGIVIEEAIF